MKISAVLFDLNGTVLEDEDEYGKAFNKVLKSLGLDLKTDIPHEKGIGVKENWLKFIEKYKIQTDRTPEMLVRETQENYLNEIDTVSVREDFADFVENLRDGGIQIALATSNTWEQTDKILDIVGLQEVFDIVTTGDEVVFNKPDPDIFTVTADKLGADREECLVIEDSPAGIEAARRAGMKVVGIASEGNFEELSKADLIVEGFSEITPQAIDQL